jgi:hypothetical protein
MDAGRYRTRFVRSAAGMALVGWSAHGDGRFVATIETQLTCRAGGGSQCTLARLMDLCVCAPSCPQIDNTPYEERGNDLS